MLLVNPRRVRPNDHAAIWKAGCAHVARLRESKVWAARIDAAHVFTQIVSGVVHSFVVGDYLVVFDIVGAWHSPGAKYFVEKLTLRLHPEDGAGSFRVAMRGIEQVARANGCTGVLLGTAGAYDGRLRRVIGRFGYTDAAVSMFKEI